MANKGINNNLLATLLVIAIVISVFGLAIGGMGSITGAGTTPPGYVNVTVGTVTACTMASGYDDAAFGSMNPSASNDTTNDSPKPLRLENSGNANIDVNVTSGGYTGLWTSQAGQDEDGGKYQWNCTNPTAGTCKITSWGNAVAASTWFMDDLPFAATNSTDLDIKVTVPTDEAPGAKTDTITFTCS